jgi:hypothetical protein
VASPAHAVGLAICRSETRPGIGAKIEAGSVI